MNSITDKISVKEFNVFLANEQTSREYSRLAERKLKKTFLPPAAIVTEPQQQSMQPKIYRYNKDELIDIFRNARSKMTKTELIARLKNPDMQEIIRNDPADIDTLLRCQMKMSKNQPTQLENGQNRNEKVYNFSKFNDHDSDSWRLDRPSPSSRVSRSGRPRASHRQTGSNARYENNREFYEPEPEWFSDGPKSMTDFIDLKGFDDDCNNNDINNEETSSESFENHKKEEDAVCSFDISNDKSKDEFSFYLDSSGDLAQLIGSEKKFLKSRSERWFKSKFSASNQDNQQTSAAPCCNSLMDLFQKQNIDINRLSDHSPKIELSSALNVSELEASFNEDNQSFSVKKKTEESSPNENEMAILSKLKFLADNRSSQDNKSVDCSNDSVTIQPQQMPGEVLKNYLLKLNHSQPSPSPPPPSSSSSMNVKFVNSQQLNSHQVPINNRVPMYFPDAPVHFVSGDVINHRMAPPMPYPIYMQRFPPTVMNNYNLMNQPTNLENPFVNVNMMSQQPNYLIPPHLQPSIHFNEFSKPLLRQQPMNEQQPQQQQDSVAHKLLKNSKFTPTSVFRKLKDHDQNRSTVGKPTIAKHDGNFSPPPAFNSFVPSNPRMADAIVLNNKGADGLKDFFQQLNLNQSNESNAKPSTLDTPKTSSNLTEYSNKLVNANDIFNVFKNSNTNTVSGLEFPPLPLQNALTVEDIEKS